MTIKETVMHEAEDSFEFADKTSSFDYLMKRIQSDTPLYAIEHGLIEDEIRSLNLLNELCKYAGKNDELSLLLKVQYSNEIAYYKYRYKELMQIREKESKERYFSVPRYSYLLKFQVSDHFEKLKAEPNS